MELNHLRYFYEVAKAGSFTHAARKLRISQSALSKAVALLEDREGVKLLQRSKKGVALTAVGNEVFRVSAGIFQAVSEIENTCRGTKAACEGSLRFGASDHVVNYWLTKKMRRLQKEHPKVVPSVFSGAPHEIIQLIFNNELEFGLFFTKVNVPGIQYESLADISMAVVCHPRLVAKKLSGPALTRSVLKQSGFIGSIRSHYQTHPAQGFIDLAGDEPFMAFESNSQEAQKRYCLAEGGVAFLARFMVEEDLKKGALVELPTAKPLSLELSVAKRKGLPLSMAAQIFLGELRP
jgi:DNA-binding transcriptional LysR family regulator